MRRVLHENSLSIVLLTLFALTLVGQSLAGHRHHNDEQQEHGEAPVGYVEYLRTGSFAGAVFENWESEFLQMSAYVLFTVFLRQKGSAESKKLRGKEPVDEDPREARDRPDVPGPVRRGGLALRLYENSLSLSLFLLFVFSFVLHLAGSREAYNEEQLAHGGAIASLAEHARSSTFWFESFQNWQSEFLSVGMLVLLSIFLRQRGSPESKPVAAPHHETGGG